MRRITSVAKIGRYELIEQIGESRSGVVYKAVQPSLGRTVVLKVFSKDCERDKRLLEF